MPHANGNPGHWFVNPNQNLRVLRLRASGIILAAASWWDAQVQRQPRLRMTNSVSVGPGSEVCSEEALRFTKVAVLCCLFNFLQIVVTHA